VLLYSGSHFMQCFEGPDEAVQKVYARILASSKHKDMVVMMDEPITQRAFGSWLMGSAKATESELLKLSTEQWTQRNSEATFPPAMPPGLGMLQVFWGLRPTEQHRSAPVAPLERTLQIRKYGLNAKRLQNRGFEAF